MFVKCQIQVEIGISCKDPLRYELFFFYVYTSIYIVIIFIYFKHCCINLAHFPQKKKTRIGGLDLGPFLVVEPPLVQIWLRMTWIKNLERYPAPPGKTTASCCEIFSAKKNIIFGIKWWSQKKRIQMFLSNILEFWECSTPKIWWTEEIFHRVPPNPNLIFRSGKLNTNSIKGFKDWIVRELHGSLETQCSISKVAPKCRGMNELKHCGWIAPGAAWLHKQIWFFMRFERQNRSQDFARKRNFGAIFWKIQPFNMNNYLTWLYWPP